MFQNLHFLVSWRLDSNSAMKTRVEVFAYCEHTCPRSSSSANNSYRCTDHAKHQQRANGEASETHCKPRGCGTFGLGLSQQVPCLFYCLQREFSFKRRRLTTQKKNTWRLLILLLQMISSAALPKLCSDAGPFDILSHALSEIPGGVDGVDLGSVNGFRGYRFETPARLAGVNSDAVFTRCNHFPGEFSIVVSFARDTSPTTNEFLLTLLAQDRSTVLLSLHLRNQRLYFDFLSNGVRHTANVRDLRLTDGAWHTVIVTVTNRAAKFTLDCRTPVTRWLNSTFPKKLNVKGARIYVASRRKKTKQFQGFLRQLFLYPGSDASINLCSSPNPPLGAPQAIVPKILFAKDVDDVLCTSSNEGSLLYNQDHTLDICAGSKFQRIREGSERLDYIEDFDDFATPKAVNMEWFEIPGEGLFVATANPSRNISYILKWSGGKFVNYQEIPESNVTSWKFFRVDSKNFLAKAKYQSRCAIYRWSGKRKIFKRYQLLDVRDARSIEAFFIGDVHFLVFAQYGIPLDAKVGASLKIQPTAVSQVFKRDENGHYKPFQELKGCNGAVDVTFFSPDIYGNVFYCFAVARSFDGLSSRILSHIYCWDFDMSSFYLRQTIPTDGAVDWEYFRIGTRDFLAVANSVSLDRSSKSYTARSTIYTLSYVTFQFVHFQDMETYGAYDWEFFTIGSQKFLAVSNSQPLNNVTNDIESVVYRWKGIEKFVEEHQLRVGRTSDFDYVRVDGEHYLTSAKPREELSKLYKIVTY